MKGNNNAKASVIVKSKFVLSDKKNFKNYINYIDRDEAKTKTDFSLYNNYMDDNLKTTSLFTNEDDYVSQEKKDLLKLSFKTAQERGSILWQDVISFDNKWLEQNGIYDSETKVIDEKKLKNITRLAMNKMLDKENIGSNPIWSGAIHHNTNNIHIHMATVELSPHKDRGKRKLKSLEGMKSEFVNRIMDRSKEHEIINNIIRNKIVNDKKERKTFGTFNRTFKKEFLEIYKALPENKRYWNYGYNQINHIKPQLNELSKNYINKYYKKEFSQFKKMLDNEVEVMKKNYGEGNTKKYESYKLNKTEELYKRLGNAFLQEMKEYNKEVTGIDLNLKKQNYSYKNVKKTYALEK